MPNFRVAGERFAHAALIVGALSVALVAASSPRTLYADDLKDGRTALQAGRLDDALQSFEKAASQGYAEGRGGVGQVWLKRRQLDKAMEAFQLAQKMDPNLALAYFGQGEVLRRQDHCDQAVPLFQRATELDRKFPEAQLALGDCLVQLKQHEKAVAALSEGLKWGPKWRPKFLVALGNAEGARDSLRDAAVYFTTARQEAPDDPVPRKALGDFYLNKRRIGSLAIPEYQAAVALDSSDVELHFALGQALFYDQRYNDALDEYRWVVNHDADYPPGQLALGDLFYRSAQADPKRYNDAKEPLEKYTRLEPNDARGWSLLGRTEFFLGMKDEALDAMAKAEQLGDKTKELFTVMGRAYAQRKEWNKAIDAFGKGDPSGRDLLILGQIFVFQGDSMSLARADSIYRSVCDRDSTSGDCKFALVEMGKLRFRARDYPGSLVAMQRRIALDHNSGEAYYYIGLSYKEMKQYPQALDALRSAAAIDSAKADRHFWLGILCAQVDSTVEGCREFARSVELDSTSSTAAVAYQQLGFCRLLEKNWTGAIPFLEHAVQLNDKLVQAWVWLGQANQNSGSRSRAVDAYKRAIQIDPKQPEANKGLKVLQGGAAPEGGTK